MEQQSWDDIRKLETALNRIWGGVPLVDAKPKAVI